MPENAKVAAWIESTGGKLRDDSFVELHQDHFRPLGFRYAARRTRFEFAKFGMSETFFVFAEQPNLTAVTMNSFGQAAFRFAVGSKAVPLPRGLFESVWCFAVALTPHLDPQVADAIRSTAPAKHWASAEIHVAFDTTTGELCYFERTPLWGAAYYAGFRRTIERYLR